MPDLHELLERRAERFVPADDGLARLRDRSRRRARVRRIEVSLLVLALATAAGAGLWRAFSVVRAPEPVKTPSTTAVPKIIATIVLPRGSDAATELVGAGPYLWYTGNDGSLRRIDPRTNRPTGQPLYCSMRPFAAFGSLWATGDNDNGCLPGSQTNVRLWRLDATTGSILQERTLDVPAAFGGARQIIPGEDGQLWVASFPEWGTGDHDVGLPSHSLLTRIDPTTMRATGHVEFGKYDIRIAGGLGSIWVSEAPTTGPGTLLRLDPDTLTTSARVSVGRDPSMAVFGESVWVPNLQDGTVSRIDPATNLVMDTIVVPDGVSNAVVAPDGIWTVGIERGVLSRIDPTTGSVTARIEIPVPRSSEVFPPTFAFGSVWVASPDQRTIWRVEPGARTEAPLVTQTPSPRSSPSPSASPTPSFDNGAPCPVPPVGVRRACVTSAQGDLDGDGRTDTISVFAWPLDRQRYPLAWHIEADTAHGTRSTRTIGGGTPPGSYPKIIGLFDANGDGRDEAFVRVDGGATNDVVELFFVLGGRLQPVQEVGPFGSRTFSFMVGGSIFEGSGAQCTAPSGQPRRLLVLGAASSDATMFHWTVDTLIWDHDVLHLAGHRSGTIHRQGDNDPRLGRFWVLNCGSVQAV